MTPVEVLIDESNPRSNLPVAPVDISTTARPTPAPGIIPATEILAAMRAMWGTPDIASYEKLAKIVCLKRQQGWPKPTGIIGLAMWGSIDGGYICVCVGGGGNVTIWVGQGDSFSRRPNLGSVEEIAAELDGLHEKRGWAQMIPIAPTGSIW